MLPMLTLANTLFLSVSGGLGNATHCSYFAESRLHGARREGDPRLQSRLGNSIHFFDVLETLLPSLSQRPWPRSRATLSIG
jgi:hypothetical protein